MTSPLKVLNVDFPQKKIFTFYSSLIPCTLNHSHHKEPSQEITSSSQKLEHYCRSRVPRITLACFCICSWGRVGPFPPLFLSSLRKFMVELDNIRNNHGHFIFYLHQKSIVHRYLWRYIIPGVSEEQELLSSATFPLTDEIILYVKSTFSFWIPKQTEQKPSLCKNHNSKDNFNISFNRTEKA